MPDTANIILNVYDGKRQLLDKSVHWSAQAIDGRSLNERKTLTFPNLSGGSVLLNVPFFDNFGDDYTIIVNADGFEMGAWRPVKVSKLAPVTMDILLLPKKGALHFAGATWDKLSAVAAQCRENDPRLPLPPRRLPRAMYAGGFEKRPASIGCFLNLVTAMADMQLPSGKNALDYYWNVCWPAGRPKHSGLDPAVRQRDEAGPLLLLRGPGHPRRRPGGRQTGRIFQRAQPRKMGTHRRHRELQADPVRRGQRAAHLSRPRHRNLPG